MPHSAVAGVTLPVAFYERPTVAVARDLLGKLLLRRLPSGTILRARLVEVEAYLGERDAASHARRGPTPRSAIMFGPPGRLYVYLIYGIHHCMNVVTESHGTAGAVLLRAAELLEAPPGETPGRGPGKLCATLSITRALNNTDLTRVDGPLWLADDGTAPARVASSARIGVDYAGTWAKRRLRFYATGNRHVSGPQSTRRPTKTTV